MRYPCFLRKPDIVPADMAQTHSPREKRSGGCAFVYEKIETFVWSVRTGYEKILHPVRIPVIWQRDAPQTDSKPVFTDILTIMKSKTVSLSRYMCRWLFPPLDSAHETDSIPARNAGTAAPKKIFRNLDMSPYGYLYTGPKHAHAL